MYDVPPVVRAKALAAGAAEWLDGLPDLILSLERKWAVLVERPLTGGTESFVAQARTDSGTVAVLKLPIPCDPDAALHEMTALRLAAGQGCARLLRSEPVSGAMLLESLGPPLASGERPPEKRLAALCAAVARLWRPAADSGLPTGAEKGRWLVDYITSAWEDLDRPCSAAVIEHAVACAERRIAAHDDERAVLVHGDVHEWNALRATDGYKLIDPDGLSAEPEHDLGVIMREERVDLLSDPTDVARRLGALTGCDSAAIWEWAAAERVSTGLLCTQVDVQPQGRQLLATADHIAPLD